ncbi:ABC transporter permease [Phototrophicus methaneseepsis]|uniref:ABC transporter permease n=2 Tax=Phototrophicus methaneseepsis TaxID=2710758 RepID=A0A7S8EBW8_9CHLR|nr:ABC transporter permease [Phototrophicus methaneseepsis]QPC84145.1 ABC transporter permease [Phototrophicus methaneseepsis]
MIRFLGRRTLYMLLTVWVISIISFVLIQLPPGDYVTNLVSEMMAQGADKISPEVVSALREQYGLNDPVYVQYFKWIRNIVLEGDFGYSLTFKRDAVEIIMERLPMTFILTSASVIFIWAVALPVGIFSAVKQYSIADYVATFVGFIGLAVPNFLFALILMYLSYKYGGKALIGLFSEQYANAPWSWDKFLDLLNHLWIPVIIIGTAGTAGLIRTMRANLLDELNRPYVDAARAKGLPETRLIWKYPVRYALNPFVSTIGWVLPQLVAGEVIVSIVLNLPTSGPVLFNALMDQDMFVAAGFILVLSALTVVGTFISDVLLAVLDPRIRLA